MRQFLFFLFLFSSFISFSQTMEERETQLVELLDELRTAKNDTAKEKANTTFKDFLEKTIKAEGAFDYSFAQLKTLGSIKSPDNTLRLFNWNVEQDDRTQKYYCLILHKDERKGNIEYSELIDNSSKLTQKPEKTLSNDEWYGALYYKIIPIEKRSKIAYTLIGWDGNNSMSTMKVVDVLYFAGNSPRLGYPIFYVNDDKKRRLFYEYSSKATMHLNYEESRKRIVMDHLSPESPSLKGLYSYYVPDLSYDALTLKNSKWYLKEDVIGTNKVTDSKIIVHHRNKDGELDSSRVKTKWINPEDKNAPIQGPGHVAVTPENEENNKKSENNKKRKKNKLSRKERKKQPASYNPVNDKKKQD